MLMHKFFYSLGLWLLVWAVSYAQPVRKVLFIGVDGCRADVLDAANTPAIDELRAQAIYSPDALCAYKTWSGNGWSTMLTGAWHTKHGATDNSFSGANFSNYPDFISRLETLNPSLRTVSVVHWAPINNTIVQSVDNKLTHSTDLQVKNSAVEVLLTDNPDVLFVAFDDVDHAGHGFGFAAEVPQYVASIELTDTYIGEILTALRNRPNYADEDWLVVVTTDHGGNLSGHGGGTLEERTIFTLYANPAFTPQLITRQSVSQTDTFAELHFLPQSYAKPIDQTPFQFGTSQDFTIELWVKPEEFTGDPSFISNKNWNSGLNPGFVISAQQGKYWKVNIGDGSDRLDIQGGNMTAGVWHHLAVSFDRDGLMTAYEDGIVVGFDRMQAIGNINSPLPVVINQDGTTTYGLNLEGSYKDIRIWNAVIPDSVLIAWAGRAPTAQHPFYDQLLANWPCEDGSGAILQDASPHQNNCLITGPADWVSDQAATFTVYDYSDTPREPDNAVTAMQWMCVPAEASWNLDGVARIPECNLVPTTEPTQQIQVRLFPNPAQEQVSVVFSSPPAQSLDASVFSYTGQLVYRSSVAAQQTMLTIPTHQLPAGVYVLTLSGPDGSSSHSFVIE